MCAGDHIQPDTKDWTWVLHEPCPQCGLDAGSLAAEDIPMVVRTQVQVWPVVLSNTKATRRPEPGTWSPLEYGAHMRDVFAVMTGRLEAMTAEDEPILADWDQDEAAKTGGYAELDPHQVGEEVLEMAEKFAATLAAVDPAQFGRRGMRSDGAAFTVKTLAQYASHELVHHLWDVTGVAMDATGENSAAGLAGSAPALEPEPAPQPGSSSNFSTGAEREAAVTTGGEADSEIGTDRDASTDPGAGTETDSDTESGSEASPSAQSRSKRETPLEPAIAGFATKHRLAVGLVTAIVALALLVWDIAFSPSSSAGGVRGVLLDWSSRVCWAMIAAIGISWAGRARRGVTNAFAYIALACWVAFLIARSV